MPASDRARFIVGRALVASAAITGSFAAAVWFGWVPIAAEGRPLIAGALAAATVLDLLIGLRFMGESAR
jgi:hypothetical protein